MSLLFYHVGSESGKSSSAGDIDDGDISFVIYKVSLLCNQPSVRSVMNPQNKDRGYDNVLPD
jgi:hypothetical protein